MKMSKNLCGKYWKNKERKKKKKMQEFGFKQNKIKFGWV